MGLTRGPASHRIESNQTIFVPIKRAIAADAAGFMA